MGNPAYRDGFYDEHGNEIRTELIDGKLVMMAPGPLVWHVYSSGSFYRILNPIEKSVEAYILRDGVFGHDNTYHQYTDEQLERMDEKQRAEVRTEFKCSLFDDLIIQAADIFDNV